MSDQRGRWIAATDDEASTLWTKRVVPGRNPFTGANLELTTIEAVDEAALFAWPDGIEATDGYAKERALFRLGPMATATSSQEDEEFSREMFRVDPAQLTEIAAMTSADPWRERIHATFPSVATQMASELTDARATAMFALVNRALERGGTVWGFFLVG